MSAEYIIGGFFTAFIFGWSVGKQLLVFRKAVESST